MAKEKKVSDAQRRAIQVLKKDGPQKAGFWSGWGDMKFGYGAFRLKIATPTGNSLVTSPGPEGPDFLPHERSFLLPAAYAARSTGQPRRSSG